MIKVTFGCRETEKNGQKWTKTDRNRQKRTEMTETSRDRQKRTGVRQKIPNIEIHYNIENK